MSTFRELFDTINSRIRSPIFGSIAVMFIIFNWKPLYFLAFASTTATARIQYFDDHTTWLSTLLGPIVAGTLFAVASPWIAFASSLLASKPTIQLRSHQLIQRDKTQTLELELKLERERKFAEGAAELTEKAIERSEKAKEINDPQILADLQEQIDEIKSLQSEPRHVQLRSEERRPKYREEMDLISEKLELYRKQRKDYADSFNTIGTKEMDQLIRLQLHKLEKISALDEGTYSEIYGDLEEETGETRQIF